MTKDGFTSFSLHPEIMEAIKHLQFEEPTPIQEQVIPLILEEQSVIGQSETGSGKTHAYLLPLMNKLDAAKHEVQIVITAPTRELASQIHQAVREIISITGKKETWRSKLLVGGTDREKMKEELKNPPHIIVGTPGRILDHVKNDSISIYHAVSFVIDEADLMLDMGFIEDVDQLLVRADPGIQILVFSATIPVKLQKFFRKYLEQPHYIQLDEKLKTPETMNNWLIARKHRSEASLIKEISMITSPYLAIIFTNGKEDAETLYDELLRAGLSVCILHGGLGYRERKRTLRDIEQLRFQYIVATDLASRGIDIEGVSHIFNAHLPHEEEFYIHRAGRTARAGAGGEVISFYSENDLQLIRNLEDKGIVFHYADIKKGEWVEDHPRNMWSNRKESDAHLDRKAWKQVPKTKKVKPGYKKKMKRQQEQAKKRLSRQQRYKK